MAPKSKSSNQLTFTLDHAAIFQHIHKVVEANHVPSDSLSQIPGGPNPTFDLQGPAGSDDHQSPATPPPKSTFHLDIIKEEIGQNIHANSPSPDVTFILDIIRQNLDIIGENISMPEPPSPPAVTSDYSPSHRASFAAQDGYDQPVDEHSSHRHPLPPIGVALNLSWL